MYESVSPITKEDIKALKKAETVIFSYDGGDKSTITTIDKKEKRHRIECGTLIDGYGKLGNVVSAIYCNSFAKYDHAYKTIVSFLKAGDKIVLRWVANNNNQYLDQAGLYNDELKLIIYRETQKGFKKFEFNIAHVVCKNNSAKMIKHAITKI